MKPFNKEELFVRLEKLLELRRKLQERYAAFSHGIFSRDSVAGQPPEPSLEDVFLQKIRQAIEEKMDDTTLGVQDLCRAVNLGHTQLFRKLKALTDEGIDALYAFLKGYWSEDPAALSTEMK